MAGGQVFAYHHQQALAVIASGYALERNVELGRQAHAACLLIPKLASQLATGFTTGRTDGTMGSENYPYPTH